jgi:FlaA1/EpsC-like NDP-sugar epimerase
MTQTAARWLECCLNCSRSRKAALGLTVDALALIGALWAAVSLKSDTLAPLSADLALLCTAALAVALPIFFATGLYRSVNRYLGQRLPLGVVVGTVLAAVAAYGCGALWLAQPLPISTYAIFIILTLSGFLFTRSLVRHMVAAGPGDREPVVIYGAGEAGARLALVLTSSRIVQPVAFVDDNPSLHGSLIHGIAVRPVDELADIIRSHDVAQVLLAMPSATRSRRREILAWLQGFAVKVQTVPDIGDILAGHAHVDDIRDVDAHDLLGRDPVAPHPQLIGACIRGKSVLVTGAGGSIGSELCRQIVRLGPARLVLLEMSELALYSIDRELRHLMARESLQLELVALLGNAHHGARVREILQAYSTQTVYHAAAYKHVPIVEQNIVEGIHNNVIGTWNLAEAAVQSHVETFVLVSTDKAVNPTNVMGATKRLAEIVLQGLHRRGTRTRFCMVRFGNVLESSGSVVPLFREQIRRGGPVTVTHPDVIRYFMTIPEAAQLVLQAGAMGQGGDVFVLDMGKPVKIDDLARRMIGLMGLTVRDAAHPDGDIEIEYTGLRPAEKLYEELLIGNDVTGTDHPMVMRATEHSLPWEQVQALLDELLLVMRQYDVRAARDILLRAVQEYAPAGDIQDLIWARRAPEQALTGKVAELPPRRARAS